MARRRTRDEAVQAESKAVRLAARGVGVREIAQALKLSESEARRKLRRGWERVGEEADRTYARAQLEAELQELLRTAYRAVDGGRPGSPPQVGALKVVVQIIAYRARLHGIELERPNVAALNSPAEATKDGNDGERSTVIAGDSDVMKKAVASVLETLDRRQAEAWEGRTATEQAIHAYGPENVRPPRPDTTAILPDEEDFVDPGGE